MGDTVVQTSLDPVSEEFVVSPGSPSPSTRPSRTAAGIAALLALLPAMLVHVLPSAAAPPAAATPAQPLPVVSPTPRSLTRVGADVVVPGRVQLVVGKDTDAAAKDLVVEVLRAHGVERVEEADAASGRAPLTLLLGSAQRPDVRRALGDLVVPEQAEGHAIRVDRSVRPLGRVTLAGRDGAGQFYAVQTLRQLFRETEDGWRIAGVGVSDAPAMALRGTIEGFYGKPWTHEERLDQLRFYGRVKANTYIYAPKDDPYHRERWREPYPADKLAELVELVGTATENHVRFTFALSPGNTICYAGDGDRQALLEKFRAMYDIGVRAFSVPLDDIALRFNCAEDRARYGTATQAAVGRAQAELLSFVQEEFVESADGVWPLQTVPTQYGDLRETPYKQAWRSHLDPEVVVMWTGTDVVPQSITVEQAQQVRQLFGRKVFVWDNYPVNDFGETAGRLLLGPYDHREPGLSEELAGIVGNPMNQAYASKPVLFTMADFAWNDRGWHRPTSARQAAADLAGGDPAVIEAVEMFVDLNHAAPRFGGGLWLPQAPRLAATLEEFWAAWRAGDADALADLRPVVDAMHATPGLIRGGVEQGFVADAARHLTATSLWAETLGAALVVLEAVRAEDETAAAAARERMETLAEQASRIWSEPGKNRVEGWVQVGDGVVDAFVADVAAEHDTWLGIPPLRNLSEGRTATQISDWAAAYGASRSVDGNLGNFSTTSGAEPQPWWQVDLGETVDVEEIRVYNRVDCCADRVRDYYVLVSEQPFPATLAAALADPAITAHHSAERAGRPTVIETSARGRYVRVWLATEQPTELNMAEVQVFGRSGEAGRAG